MQILMHLAPDLCLLLPESLVELHGDLVSMDITVLYLETQTSLVLVQSHSNGGPHTFSCNINHPFVDTENTSNVCPVIQTMLC